MQVDLMAQKKQTSIKKKKPINQETALIDSPSESPSSADEISLFRLDRYQILFLSLLILFGTVIYSNSLHTPFVFDDKPAITENPFVRMETIGAKSIIDAATGYGKNRPVSMLSFGLNYYFGRYNVLGYHLVNIFIHIINGILLFLLVKLTLTLSNRQTNTTRKLDPITISTLSFFTALLWLTNPVQTQSVTYIVQRMNSMGAMFYILALILYAQGRIWQQRSAREGDDRQRRYLWWFAGCFLAGLLALGSKESTALLPVFIFLYEWYFFQDLDKKWFKSQLKYLVAIVLLFGLVAGLYLGFDPSEKFTLLRDYALGEFTIGKRLLTQTRVVIYYLSLIFYPNPSRLNLDHDFPLSFSLFNPFTTFLSLITIVGLIALGLYLARKQRLISFCIFWFFGNLVIESSVIPLALVYEHRLYLPSMLVCLMTVTLLYRHIKSKWLPEVIICVFAILCSYWTFERNKVWCDEMIFWTDCVKKSPNKARPYSNLGAVQAERQKTDEAIQNYLKALQINPNYVDAHYNFGAALAMQGKTDEAMEHYRKALQIDPYYTKAYNNLGLLLAKQGRINEATECYRKALKIEPGFAEAHNNLGVALVELDRMDEAEKQYRKTLHYKPDYAETYNNLAILYTKQGKIDAAVENYLKAVQLKPNYAEAYNNLGFLLSKQGRIAEAVENYNRALEIDPSLKEAQLNLGNALVEQGKTEQGINHIKIALQLKPDYAEAHNNLGGQLLKEGKIDEALVHFKAALKTNPDMAETHNNIGIILIHKGKVSEAVFHFQEAVRINPEFELAKDNLRRALAIQQKQMDTEMERILAALKNNPDDPVLNYVLGNLYLGKGELNHAIGQFQKTLSLQPNFPAALNNLAMAHIFSRQYDQALEAFQKLIALQPDNAANYYNVAVLYALQTNVTESLAWLNKAVAKGYDNWDLIKTDKDLENIRNAEGYRELVKGR